jgi:hypothetical protein
LSNVREYFYSAVQGLQELQGFAPVRLDRDATGYIRVSEKTRSYLINRSEDKKGIPADAKEVAFFDPLGRPLLLESTSSAPGQVFMR